jgi:hypothetical protein
MTWRASIRPCQAVAIVEIDEVAALDIDRADRETHGAVVHPFPIDQFVKRLPQAGGVVKTERTGRSCRRPPGRQNARGEEAGNTPCRDRRRGGKMFHLTQIVAVREAQIGHAAGHALPEGGEFLQPLLTRIAGDDRRVHRADRNTGDPVDLDAEQGQFLDDTGLKRSKRAAALKDQRHGLRQRQRRLVAQGFRARHEQLLQCSGWVGRFYAPSATAP